jgi:hypothetical protein
LFFSSGRKYAEQKSLEMEDHFEGERKELTVKVESLTSIGKRHCPTCAKVFIKKLLSPIVRQCLKASVVPIKYKNHEILR